MPWLSRIDNPRPSADLSRFRWSSTSRLAYLTRFLDAAFQTMRPGAPLILETINPACWMAFFETYLRDLTHQQPLHAETLISRPGDRL